MSARRRARRSSRCRSGLSFLVAGTCRELTVTVRWGDYAPVEIEEADGNKTPVWRRTPRELSLSIPLGGSADPVMRDVPGSDRPAASRRGAPARRGGVDWGRS